MVSSGPKSLAEIESLLKGDLLFHECTAYGCKKEVVYAIKGYNEWIGRLARFSRRNNDHSCPQAYSRKDEVKAVCNEKGCRYSSKARRRKGEKSWHFYEFSKHTCAVLNDTKTNYSPTDLAEAVGLVNGDTELSDFVQNKLGKNAAWQLKKIMTKVYCPFEVDKCSTVFRIRLL